LAKDQFDEILIQHIEPHLGCDRPTFLYDYPSKMAALAKIKETDPTVAERFELYIGGMEIANGFSELTDAREQRRRFEEALEARAARHQVRYAMPEISGGSGAPAAQRRHCAWHRPDDHDSDRHGAHRRHYRLPTGNTLTLVEKRSIDKLFFSFTLQGKFKLDLEIIK